MDKINNTDAVRMLTELRRLESETKKINLTDSKAESADFSSMLKDAINKSNDIQQGAEEIKGAYEMGDPNVSIAKVMIESQKANLSFQTILHVRNKFINAYKEIMNMQF